jgi:REP element-mobilizing transposase RayT
MAFLITWTTYNSWLPGDPRGFRTRKGKEYVPPPARYARDESRFYKAGRYNGLYRSVPKSNAVRLSETQQQTVLTVIGETIQEQCPGHALVCVGENHVHLLLNLANQTTVPKFCNYAKGRSARRLIALGHSGKVWARGYHAEHVDSQDWEKAAQYILKHRNDKDTVCELKN